MLLAASATASADLLVTVEEVGSDVIFTSAGGSLDLTALTFANPGAQTGLIIQDSPNAFFVGPTGPPPSFGRVYTGAIAPSDFVSAGVSGFTNADSGSGPIVGASDNFIFLPFSYSSGSVLGASTATYNGSTFNSLGLIEGAYTWSWGSGATADSMTLQIGPAAVPEPGSFVLFGMGVAGLGFTQRRKRANRCSALP